MYELHEAAAELLAQLEQGWAQRDDGVAIALRQALAQYGQEPINKMPTKIFSLSLEQILNAAGFYKREWVGLTNEEISAAYNANYDNYYNDVDIVDYITIVRAVEAILREKNEQS